MVFRCSFPNYIQTSNLFLNPLWIWLHEYIKFFTYNHNIKVYIKYLQAVEYSYVVQFEACLTVHRWWM